MSHVVVLEITDPGPLQERESRPQRLKKAGGEGLITFGSVGPGKNLISRREIEVLNFGLHKTRLAEGFDHSPLPHIASRQW
jgi:hypothetical protein